jgi:hypothetical protein
VPKRGKEKWDESRSRREVQRRKCSKMGKRSKDKLLGHLERMEEDRMPKNWKRREEGEEQGKDGKRKQKEIFKCWE